MSVEAGFARVCTNPPIGTTMTGFLSRDREHGCTGIHDDLFVRALYVSHGGEDALILSYDLCFLAREEADRFRGAIGRRVDLSPRQILLNSSHTHSGPCVGNWGLSLYGQPDRLYVAALETATVEAACQARESARPVHLRACSTRTRVPLSRRRREPDGRIAFAPAPEGFVYDRLPVCLLADASGEAVCLLFSISCHPSTLHGWEMSADYPGVACAELDAHLGATASMFLQGTGGDAKACVIGKGQEWSHGTHEDVAAAGHMAAQEVMASLDTGLTEVAPDVGSHSVEMQWPTEPPPDRAHIEAMLADPEATWVRQRWAERQIALLDRGATLQQEIPIACHGVKLGDGVRLVGLEGEAVAGLGQIIDEFYGGVTFPMGYTDGAQLYLPTEAMLPEGGYEVDSYHEYGLPSRFVPGIERELGRALRELRANGIT